VLVELLRIHDRTSRHDSGQKPHASPGPRSGAR
jgi:hypothetical protein